MRPFIQDAIRAHAVDAMAVAEVQARAVARILPIFRPLYDAAPGQAGFVSIQGDPFLEDSAEHIVREVERHRALGANMIAKIPATEAGLAAIERVIAMDVPVLFTEIFSVAQAVACGELYQRACRASGKAPAAFLTHITGIFDEYIAGAARTAGLHLELELLREAGWIVARRQAQVCAERGFGITILGGGARAPHHFTDMVGGAMHVTLNWDTVESLMEADLPTENRLGVPIDEGAARQLSAALPDFRRAWQLNGLSIGEFEAYGPVRFFRENFMRGWVVVRDAVIAARRAG